VLDQQQFVQLVRRIEVLEARINQSASVDQRLSKRALATRWGVSARTIDRMRERPDFPAPEIENHRCYWWLATIIAYERLRARTTDRTSDNPRAQIDAA
jgi:hypothetical protein